MQELLIATRHILATDFRRGFIPHLDDLLEESLFLGPGQPATLRPVAYYTIGDLVREMKVSIMFMCSCVCVCVCVRVYVRVCLCEFCMKNISCHINSVRFNSLTLHNDR